MNFYARTEWIRKTCHIDNLLRFRVPVCARRMHSKVDWDERMFMIPIKSVNATLMVSRIINYKSDESTKSNKKQNCNYYWLRAHSRYICIVLCLYVCVSAAYFCLIVCSTLSACTLVVRCHLPFILMSRNKVQVKNYYDLTRSKWSSSVTTNQINNTLSGRFSLFCSVLFSNSYTVCCSVSKSSLSWPQFFPYISICFEASKLH